MKKPKDLKNKIYGLAFIVVGALTFLIERDATFFLFSLIFGIPMLFAKENLIYED